MPDAAPRPATVIFQTAPALLRDTEAAAYLGVSPRTLWQMVATGKTPKPVKLPSGNSTRWRRADLDSWLENLPTE